MSAVLVCGVAVLDLVLAVDELPREAAKYRARDAAVIGGGCAANAAVAIARLGGRAQLAARLGDDVISDIIANELGGEGVNLDLVQRTPGARGSFSSVLIDARGERQIVNFRGSGLTTTTDWIVPGEDCGAVLADTRWTEGGRAAMQAARVRGVPGILDAEAPMDPGLLPLATHVAFSAQGLRSLFGQDDLADGLRRAGKEVGGWLCVTDGANGVWMNGANGVEHVPAFAVDVKDTLGAGDVWHGAFALRLAEGAGERDAVIFANAVAALKCTRFGGRAGTPTCAETELFLKERGI